MTRKNQRQTRQKTLILETIRQETAPVTADLILMRARQTLPGLALTTVYRNLEQLTVHQTITRLIYPDGITRYQLASALHHHELVCLSCARTVEVSQCPLECLARQIESESGFVIVSHHMALYGYCESCQQKRTAD